MNKFRLTIDTTNTAFDDDDTEEIARILESVAQTLRDDYHRDRRVNVHGTATDNKGNTVCLFTLEPRERP